MKKIIYVEELRMAVIKQTLADYVSALKYGDRKAIVEIERDALSDYFIGMYAYDVDMEYLLRECRKRVKKT